VTGKTRQWLAIAIAVCTVGGLMAGLTYVARSTGPTRPASALPPAGDGEQSDSAENLLPDTTPTAAGSPTQPTAAAPSPTTGRSRTSPPAPPRPKTTTPPAPPAPWIYAPTGGPAAGTGRILRYLVAVETVTGQDVKAFADHVQSTLNNAQRGWIRSGRWGFQRVTTGPADFTVWLATPATTDAICARYGIRTEGKVSCRGGPNVVINLDRWRSGIPAYDGQVGQYQHLVINHEVGHFLGQLHVLCPGAGQPAPVMQTQFYGMNGCVPNVWPYADDGTFVTGPPPP
jgi:hypothetical protein